MFSQAFHSLLRCLDHNPPLSPSPRSPKVANYEVEKVEVNVRVNNDTTISTLTLRDAQVHNSGKYTCSPSNARQASIRVHVLSGESRAA